MKSLEDKQRFIELRAAGRSYPFCQKTLGISKSTCQKWTKECETQIQELRRANLETLYNEYGMSREARIRSFGNTLYAIEDALTEADLKEVPPDKLLEMKLKYQAALKNEYISPQTPQPVPQDAQASDVMDSMANLLVRVQSGEVNADQAKREMDIMTGMVKAIGESREAAKMSLLMEALGTG